MKERYAVGVNWVCRCDDAGWMRKERQSRARLQDCWVEGGKRERERERERKKRKVRVPMKY